jgi:seryl-tRNA synthetase
MQNDSEVSLEVPFFGARKAAKKLVEAIVAVRKQRDDLKDHLNRLGALTVVELEQRRIALLMEVKKCATQVAHAKETAAQEEQSLRTKLEALKGSIVQTEEIAILQEAGVYKYRHPLGEAVLYEQRLETIDDQIKEMTKKDGGAVHCVGTWTVNGSEAQGRAMVRDISKLMLRAFNAEADNQVRSMKPHKIDSAIDRLQKVAETIERLGRTMQIRISDAYLRLRVKELELTSDFVQKEAEEKEAERVERERLREEKKAQQELERERARLEKEKKHYENALNALIAKGDDAGASRLKTELEQIDRAMKDVDYRAANIRAGYVYVISNIGSFGESVVKIGMTRRLDPLDRIRELSDASVPFNFDVHALFFSKDAVGIESALHERFSPSRINKVNPRREFFQATPAQVKLHLAELAGELLQFQDIAEAIEYRQCLAMGKPAH